MEKYRAVTPRTKDQGSLNSLGPRKIATQQSTDRMADYLVNTFQAEEYRPAFNKIAWRLEDGEIQRMAGTAKEVASNPRAYFLTCAKNEIKRRGL